MSTQLNIMSEFCKAKSLSIESDYANRNEIKRIDNNSEKGFSTEIDKLNESLYKINNYLKLTKDIEDIKKDNLVKNDIQRKLSLKSQWLNSNHGSTISLNSLPPLSSYTKNAFGHGSSQSLNKGEIKKTSEQAKKKRKNFENFKSQSVQNVNAACERPIRRLGKRSICASYDELDFVDKLKLSDEDVRKLSQEPNFQDKKCVGNASKVNERKSRIRSLSASQSSSVSSSQRDLSRYFPKKEIKTKPMNINQNQKELKDVDLSKYFLPAPVQELKSLPSPGQSPKLPRRSMQAKSFDETQSSATTSLLRAAIDNLQKVKRPESFDSNDDSSVLRNAIDHLQKVEKPESSNIDAKMDGFTLRNHQLDGDVGLQKPSKIDKFQFVKTPKSHESRPERKESEPDFLFDGMKSPVDNIDALFEKVAADVCPEAKPKIIEKIPMKSQSPKMIRKIAKCKPIEIEKVELKSNFPPASKLYRKELAGDPNKREAEILSKLSSNLLNEIKLLEQHLQLNEENKSNDGKKVKKLKKDKRIEEPIDKCNIEHMQTEEELNCAIDDILKSIPIKEEQVPQSVMKKIAHVILPKPSNGLRSKIDSLSKPDIKPQRKVSQKSPMVPLATKAASTPSKSQNQNSIDTVDFAIKTPERLIRSNEMVQRVASIEKDIATFMVEQSIPTVNEMRSIKPLFDKQRQNEPKIEITQPTPQIEKGEVEFAFVKPMKKQSLEMKFVKQENVSKEKGTSNTVETSSKNTFAQESKTKSTEPLHRDKTEIDSSPKNKPLVNELIRKITPSDIQRTSIENKLLFQSNRKPMLSKTYKVHLPLDEPEIKSHLAAVKSTVASNTEINENKIESHPIVLNPEPATGQKKQNDFQSNIPNKPVIDELKAVDSTEARNAFFADWDELNSKSKHLPEKSTEHTLGKHIHFHANNQNSSEIPVIVKTKAEPPMKPARRRSLKSSVSAYNDINGDEQPPNASKPYTELPNRDDSNLSSNKLAQFTDMSKHVPELKNITQILDSPKSLKTEVEVVELIDNYAQPISRHDTQSILENGDRKIDEKNTLMEPQKHNDYRLSGASEYDNVVPTVNRRTKLVETRKQSRSFELPSEMAVDYADNVKARKSADRFSSSPPPTALGVSTLERKKNVTDMLLERSKNLHHKKQEFMTEKLTESNPYIRRMMEKEARFRPDYERSRISPLSMSAHYTQPYSHSISRPLPSSVTSTASPLSYSTRVTTPSSSSRGVLNRLRHPTSSNKDSCVIS